MADSEMFFIAVYDQGAEAECEILFTAKKQNENGLEQRWES